MSPQTRRIALLSLALVVLTVVFVFRVGPDMIDFEVGYRAGQRLLAGEDLYDVQDGHFMFKYLPGAAVLEVPFALLPLGPAKFIFYWISIGCVLAGLALSYRLVGNPAARARVLTGLTFVILAKYLVREIYLGQINLIITVLLLIALERLIASERTRSGQAEALAGLAWGAATMIKPYGLIFLPYLLLRKKWRALACGLAVMAAVSAATTPFYGVQGGIDQHRQWASTLSHSTPPLLFNEDNTSYYGAFTRWTGDPQVGRLLWVGTTVVLALLMLALIVRRPREPGSVALEGASLMLLIPLLAPLGWNYMLLMSMPAVMLLIYHRGSFAPVWRRFLVANLAMIAVTTSALIGGSLHSVYENISGPTINFTILLAFLAALRFRRVC